MKDYRRKLNHRLFCVDYYAIARELQSEKTFQEFYFIELNKSSMKSYGNMETGYINEGELSNFSHEKTLFLSQSKQKPPRRLSNV